MKCQVRIISLCTCGEPPPLHFVESQHKAWNDDATELESEVRKEND